MAAVTATLLDSKNFTVWTTPQVGSSISVTAGDWILVLVHTASNSGTDSCTSFSGISGLTLTEIGTAGGGVDDWDRVQAFTGKAGTTTSGSLSATFNTNVEFGAFVVLRLNGVDATTPEVSAGRLLASSITVAQPDRANADNLRVVLVGSWHDRTSTANTGWTKVYESTATFTTHVYTGNTDTDCSPTYSDTSTNFLSVFALEFAVAAAAAADQFNLEAGEEEATTDEAFEFSPTVDTDVFPDQFLSAVEEDTTELDEDAFASAGAGDAEEARSPIAIIDYDASEDREDETISVALEDNNPEAGPGWFEDDAASEVEPEELFSVAAEELASTEQVNVWAEREELEDEPEFATTAATEDLPPEDQIKPWIEEDDPDESESLEVAPIPDGHDPAGILIDVEDDPDIEQWAAFDATDAIATEGTPVLIIEDFDPAENEPEWFFPDAGAPPVVSTDLPIGFLDEFEPPEPEEWLAEWLQGFANNTGGTLRFGAIGSTASLRFSVLGSMSAMTRAAWDPRAVSGIVAWYDAYATSSTDSFGWLRPTYATLLDATIATDYTSSDWGKPGMTVSLVTDGAQFLETAATSFHYAGRTADNYWATSTAVGAYTTVRAQFELIDGADRLLWTGDASTPPATPVAFEAWWGDTGTDARAGANIVSRTFETISTLRRRLTVTYRATADSQSIRFGVGRLGTLPSYLGSTSKGFRLYSPEINQPKVSALTNRVTLTDALQATLHGPQPGYESPVVRGIRGYGSQYLTTTDALVLAALSGNDPTYTIVATVKRVGSGSVQAILGARDSVGSKWRLGFDASNRLTVVRDAASLTESSADAGAHQVITLLANGTGYTLRRNSVVVATGTVDAGALTMTSLDILGNGAQSQLFNGHVGDLLIYDRVLGTGELSYVEAGLAARLGV